MMHEYYEMSIEQVCSLPKEEFLDRCAVYLEEVQEEERRRNVDRQARAYARLLGLSVDDLDAIW